MILNGTSKKKCRQEEEYAKRQKYLCFNPVIAIFLFSLFFPEVFLNIKQLLWFWLHWNAE
jgi:hypothetical protein